MIHEIAPVISNEYNALAVKHQSTIKRKTTDNDDTAVSEKNIAGKDDSATKMVKEEVIDATKIIEEEEGIDATKFAVELGNASEDKNKAVSLQTTLVNEFFMGCFNNPNYGSTSDTSSLDVETK
uniref:Uncharacterized protein n=1 Tax=Romanomermis culicivorax TaxID=13658 RepID=A0A915JBB5_ROMCU